MIIDNLMIDHELKFNDLFTIQLIICGAQMAYICSLHFVKNTLIATTISFIL